MKPNKKIVAIALAVLIIAAGIFLAVRPRTPQKPKEKTVVTSFYPIWLITLNLTSGVDSLTVRNLAAPTVGCLHDYQLQTSDMKSLSDADALLVNGAGMESFLPEITRAFPNLPVLTASEGIELLQEGDAVQIGDPEEEEVNSHIWLDPVRAVRMAENLAAGLTGIFPEYGDAISANLESYRSRLLKLDEKLRDGLKDLPRREIVTFHEAFPYFAAAYGLKVVAVVNKEPGEVVSPAQMGDLVREITRLGNPPLFVEPQYTDLSAETLARETGSAVYSLDPVVTGPAENVPLDYYETVMLKNMDVLIEALSAGETAR